MAQRKSAAIKTDRSAKRSRSTSRGRRSQGRERILPEAVTQLVRQRMLQLAGLGVIAFGALLTLALATYHASDPSWSATGSFDVKNLLGQPGSHIADALYQGFGFGAFVVPLVLFVWGSRLIAAQAVGAVLWRLFLLPAALVLVSMALSAPAPDLTWPAPTGPGGLMGQHFYEGTRTLLQASAFDVELWIVSAAAGVLGLVFLLLVLGITPGEWRAIGAFMRRAFMAAWRWGRREGAGEGERGRTPEPGRAPRPVTEPAREPTPAAALAERSATRTVARANGTGKGEDRQAKKAARTRERSAAKSAAKAAARAGLVEDRAPPPQPGKQAEASRQPRLALEADSFSYPSLELLQTPARSRTEHDEAALEQNARYLETVLQDFGIKGQVVKVRPGPVVTLYELEPAPGVKAARVVNLADDIARSMSAVAARVAVIPGRNVIGIELPNSRREMVYLRELLASDAFERTAAKLPMVLGKDIGGQPVIGDLARMPHLLIAGTTGSGKSVGINTLILSLLYTLPPSRCRFIMVDPKMLELSMYDDIPHLLAPVVTDPKKAVVALRWTVREMESRYQAMSKLGVRNLDGYNARVEQALRKGERITEKVRVGTDEAGKPVYQDEGLKLEPLPYIVVIVDEMADLMMVAGKDIEAAVQRLAQMARAAGIHLIMATQRPSVDVITGTIKANFPTRISFQVTSKIDSRTILGEQGGEQLLGQGDMLYMMGGGRITRVHGPFVSDEEVDKVVAHLRKQGQPSYVDEVTTEEEGALSDLFGGGDESDELFRQAVQIVLQEGRASTSFIQRKLQIGYNRAARIMEQMEEDGIVSAANHAGKREILVDHV